MNILTDTEQDYLQRMIDVKFQLDEWRYGDYGGGCAFSTTIDGLKYNLWYSGSIVQVDISNEEHTTRLGIRLNDVAGWYKEHKNIIYQHKVYSSCGCSIVGKDEIPEETLELVNQVLSKLEMYKDAWKPFWRESNDS